jgi:hypothetical protein
MCNMPLILILVILLLIFGGGGYYMGPGFVALVRPKLDEELLLRVVFGGE